MIFLLLVGASSLPAPAISRDPRSGLSRGSDPPDGDNRAFAFIVQ